MAKKAAEKKSNGKAKAASKKTTAKKNETQKAETTAVAKKGNVTAISKKAQECRERIETAVTKMTANFVTLSTALLEAYENDYAAQWGFPNFMEYVEGHLGLKYRKCMYWVNSAQAIRDLKLDESQVERIGWTRFKEIAPLLLEASNNKERTSLLKMAEENSTSQLKDKLKEKLGVKKKDGKPATVGVMRLSTKFEGDAMSIMSDGLNLAYGELGTEDVSVALQHIVSEWMMAKGSGGQNATLEDWLNYLETTYEVKLVKAEEGDNLDSLLSDGETAEDAETGDELDSLLDGSDGATDDSAEADDDLEALLS